MTDLVGGSVRPGATPAPSSPRAAGESRLPAGLDSLLDPHVTLDPIKDAGGAIVDFVYTGANDAALRAHHQPPGGLVGRRMLEVFPLHVDTGMLAAYARVVESGEPLCVHGVSVLDPVVGEVRYVDVRCLAPTGTLIVTWRDTADQHSAASALAESEQQYRLLAENASDVVLRTDLDGCITWASPAVRATLGWEPAALLRTSMSDLVLPVDASGSPHEGESPSQRLAAEPSTGRFRTSTGGYRWLAGTAKPLHDEQGDVVGSVVGLRDVHAEVLARQSLEESEALFRTAMSVAATGMVINELDLSFRVVNRAFRDFVQRDEQWLFSHTLADVLAPETMETVARDYRALMDGTAASIVSNLRFVRADGKRLWARVAVVLIRGRDGSPEYILAQIEDVTAEQEARAAVVAGQQRLRGVVDTLVDPWVLLGAVRDGAGRIVDFVYLDANPEACQANRTTRERLIGARLLDLFPDHGRLGVFDHYAAVVESGTPGIDDDLEFPDPFEGTLRRFDNRAVPVGDGISLTWRDVTERHAQAQALADSEHRYRLLAEHASDVVYQTDAEGVVLWMAPAVEQSLGWRAADLVGTRTMDLVHPEDRQNAASARQRLLSGKPVTTPATRFRTALGTFRSMAIRADPLTDERGVLTGAVVALRDVTAEVAAQQELEYLAFHDPLTGLRNRTWILGALDTALSAASRDGSRVGVLFVDLDNFKVINDSLGHVVGDQTLARIAERIVGALSPRDRVGRFGGDEFIVVAPGVHEARELEEVARRLSAAISTGMSIQNRVIVPTASIGIAISDPTSTSTSLIRDTDAALFRAKAAGRSQWQFFDEGMHARALARLTTEHELRRSVADHDFVVHYQPIVALADATVVGHEALVRWRHPQRGLLAPGAFLAIAEDSGLIVEIGDQVLQEVCAMLRDRPDLPGAISVNKSPVQIARPGWRERFEAILKLYDVDPHRVTIEVTETAILSVIDSTRDDLAALRDLGVGIHVDDFGTGYSSIALLRDLPVTGLKLDMSFTTHLLDEQNAAVLSAALAGLANSLGLDSIAEGIETKRQAETLREQGWAHGQGFYYGRPAPLTVRSRRPPTL